MGFVSFQIPTLSSALSRHGQYRWLHITTASVVFRRATRGITQLHLFLLSEAYTSLTIMQIVAAALGEDTTYVLTYDGRVFSWGSNDYGQLVRSDLVGSRLLLIKKCGRQGISDGSVIKMKTPDGKLWRLDPQVPCTVEDVEQPNN